MQSLKKRQLENIKRYRPEIKQRFYCVHDPFHPHCEEPILGEALKYPFISTENPTDPIFYGNKPECEFKCKEEVQVINPELQNLIGTYVYGNLIPERIAETKEHPKYVDLYARFPEILKKKDRLTHLFSLYFNGQVDMLIQYLKAILDYGVLYEFLNLMLENKENEEKNNHARIIERILADPDIVNLFDSDLQHLVFINFMPIFDNIQEEDENEIPNEDFDDELKWSRDMIKRMIHMHILRFDDFLAFLNEYQYIRDRDLIQNMDELVTTFLDENPDVLHYKEIVLKLLRYGGSFAWNNCNFSDVKDDDLFQSFVFNKLAKLPFVSEIIAKKRTLFNETKSEDTHSQEFHKKCEDFENI